MNERLPSSSLLAILLLMPAAAAAFDLIPISQEFDSSGSGATRTYELVNSSRDHVAVELRTMQRSVDIAGKESLTEGDDDFLIFPAQVILEPGTRQTIRVSYIGEPAPTRELAYRLVAEQLPIDGLGEPVLADEAEKRGKVKVLLTYKGSLYVRPPNSTPKLRVIEATGKRTENGAAELELKLANGGTARAAFRDYEIQVKSNGESSSWISLKSFNVAPVLAGSERQVTLSWPEKLPWSQKPTVETRNRR